jgi:hypothetical protein
MKYPVTDEMRRKARRASGIARFERECKCVEFEGRRRKAYRVPGTRESGRWNMLNHATNDRIQAEIVLINFDRFRKKYGKRGDQ